MLAGDDELMTGGFNQEVEIFGRTYHVQTELSDTGIRTEVFHGGTLVATREKPLAAAEREGSHLLVLIQKQHEKILAGVAKRIRQYAERRQAAAADTSDRDTSDRDTSDRETPGRGTPTPAPRPAAAAPTPRSVARTPGGAVDIGLRVRRFLERFRRRLGPLPRELGGGARLERAAEQFAWVVSSPEFPRLRIDEQVRFNLIHDQLESWLRSARDPEEGRRIWSEIRIFDRYLAEINNRAELAAFDRDLLAWALRRLEADGMSDRLREHLALATGRDGELDRLLAAPETAGDEVWAAELRRVLAELDQGVG